MLHQITIDVYCQWSDVAPAYRIYVDDDMITERAFRFPGDDFFIKEYLTCNLDPGLHSLRLEQCSPNGQFSIKNIVVDDRPNAEHPNYVDPAGRRFRFIVN